MLTEVNYVDGGGGTPEDLVLVIRANGAARQSQWLGKFVNQYKYVRLLTTAEAVGYYGSAANDWVNTTSATYNVRIGSTWSSDYTIGTTDIDVSSLGMGDTDGIYIGSSTSSSWYGFCLYFHN